MLYRISVREVLRSNNSEIQNNNYAHAGTLYNMNIQVKRNVPPRCADRVSPRTYADLLGLIMDLLFGLTLDKSLRSFPLLRFHEGFPHYPTWPNGKSTPTVKFRKTKNPSHFFEQVKHR